MRGKYLFITGPFLGILAAWIWGGTSWGWLGTGLVFGLAADLVAARYSDDEWKPGARAVAFFLTFQAVFAAIPFLALSGAVPVRQTALEAFHPLQLLLVPVAAIVATAVRQALHPRFHPDRRARPPREAPEGTHRRWLWILGALVLLALCAAADAMIPSPYSLDFLYMVPALLVAWHAGYRGGVLLAVLAGEARGIVRGVTFPGELEPLLVGLETTTIMVGLWTAAFLLQTIRDQRDSSTTAARKDVLTGLNNRMAFLEAVEHEVERAAGPISVAYLDLDGFKAVNDTHGHAVGDEVLRIVANVIRTSIRAEDVPARFGGDEFALLLPETDPDVAPRIAERVRSEIEDRMRAFERDVTCSVGMVTSTRPGPTTEELLRHADDLMYEVKREGKNALRQLVMG